MTRDSKGEVVPLHGHRHEELWDLLPWYVTGRLDASEQAEVEAHIGKCAECQAEVRFQRRLSAEVAALPLAVEHGWQAMQRRLQADAPRIAAKPLWRAWVGWAAAALLLTATGALILPIGQKPAYHALGAPPAPAAGNLMVIFQPDTREQDLRASLDAVGARLVDGPTASGGYVLRVPTAERPAALARLRTQPNVVLAEPIGEAR